MFTACNTDGDTGGKLGKVPVTWSGYHSHNQNTEDIRPPATIGIFPEFYDKAASMSMQKHGMLMMQEATDKANPGQVTVIVGDGPLYKIMKELQWLNPDNVGFTKIVCIMGFLHLEMCNQECGGKLMGGSGWVEIFSIAGIFTPGVCNSLLGGKHVKRTRYTYKLTLLWLSIMKDRAWEQ